MCEMGDRILQRVVGSTLLVAGAILFVVGMMYEASVGTEAGQVTGRKAPWPRHRGREEGGPGGDEAGRLEYQRIVTLPLHWEAPGPPGPQPVRGPR